MVARVRLATADAAAEEAVDDGDDDVALVMVRRSRRRVAAVVEFIMVLACFCAAFLFLQVER